MGHEEIILRFGGSEELDTLGQRCPLRKEMVDYPLLPSGYPPLLVVDTGFF